MSNSYGVLHEEVVLLHCALLYLLCDDINTSLAAEHLLFAHSQSSWALLQLLH